MSDAPRWDELWQGLVSTAVLGAERRDPPDLTIGAVADFVADGVNHDPAARLVAAVAATVAGRRAGFVPLPPGALIERPVSDHRPVLPADAAIVGESAIARWPILEDEWMIELINAGWRLPPDVLVSALVRSRQAPARRARVLLAGGAVTEWLVELFGALAPVGGRGAYPNGDDPLRLPDDLSSDVAELAVLDAATFAERIVVETLDSSGSATARQKILTTLIARSRPAVLVDAADVLGNVGTSLAVQLVDLARTRHRMLESLVDLGPAPIAD